MADLSIGCTGPPDKASIISKSPRINTHLYIIKLGVEQHKWVGSGKNMRMVSKHKLVWIQ